MTRDTKLSLSAGLLFVAGALIGGLIIASGLFAAMPGADALMAIALALLVPTTLGMMRWLYLLGRHD